MGWDGLKWIPLAHGLLVMVKLKRRKAGGQLLGSPNLPSRRQHCSTLAVPLPCD